MSTSRPPGQGHPAIPETKTTKKNRKKGAKDKSNGEVNEAQKSVPELADQSDAKSTARAVEEEEEHEPEEGPKDSTQSSPSTKPRDTPPVTLTNGSEAIDSTHSARDRDARFEALVKDRDALRLEVTELRESLEELQTKHQTTIDSVREELKESQTEKEHAEEQYQNLLGKVNTIKAQLGERLKADAADLAQARSHIEVLEEENSALQQQQSQQSSQIESLTSDAQGQAKELSSLRNRSNLSQQNWLKEREDLIEQEAYMREQYENAEQAMREWEVLALEERSIRKDLGEKVGDLEEQVSGLKESYERAATERDSQSTTVDGLQKALQEIQSARKKELREIVESSQAEADRLRSQLVEAQNISTSAAEELESVKKELERALPFEKEAKEKNLLIGKLRHEAVTLNEHLTKALRFLKRGKPEDNVDRQIVTNHLLHFLTLDRSDPKKFQILQLIAALLGWTDEQRQQAGLSRPGASTANAIPNTTGNSNTSSPVISPSGSFSGGVGAGNARVHNHSPLVQRSTPGTPALSMDPFQDMAGTTAGRRESLAEMWQGFLQQESGAKKPAAAAAAEAGDGAGDGSGDEDKGRRSGFN